MTNRCSIDKTTATISAIRDYENMRQILNNTPDSIKIQYENLLNPRSTALDGIPGAQNSHAGEDMWAAGLDRLDLMRSRYHEADLFIMWFEPMWLALSEQERMLLETYKSDSRSGAMAVLANKLQYSIRQLTRFRQKALDRLSKLLFGY